MKRLTEELAGTLSERRQHKTSLERRHLELHRRALQRITTLERLLREARAERNTARGERNLLLWRIDTAISRSDEGGVDVAEMREILWPIEPGEDPA